MTRPPDCTETGNNHDDEKDDHDDQKDVCGDSDNDNLDHHYNTDDDGVFGNNDKDSSKVLL